MTHEPVKIDCHGVKVFLKPLLPLILGTRDRLVFSWVGALDVQIFQKYPGPNGRLLLRACHEVFDVLPLCALIQVRLVP